jgi:DNA-binding beta-propeller fold protein YncE
MSDSLSTKGGLFRLVHDFGRDSKPSGAVVTPDGRYYVTALAGRQSVVVLDVRDPWKPRQVSSVRLDRVPMGKGEEDTVSRKGGPGDLAVSANGERIAVANYTVQGPSITIDGDRRVYLLRLDGGKLRVDTRFRDEDSGEVGVDFNRREWPHGKTGPARPRGVVFVAPAGE